MKINWKYAFGEIAIVIIGITIAFMLNSWAAKHQDRTLAKQYLENLKVDLESDAQSLERNIAKIQQSLGINQKITTALRQNTAARDSLAMLYFGELNKDYLFFPITSTFEALKYSGDLKLIRNFQLRTDIVKHYSLYELVGRARLKYENVHTSYTARIMMEEVDFKNMFRYQDFSFFDHPVIQNSLYSNYGILNQMLNDHKLALRRCQDLIVELDGELSGVPGQAQQKASE